MLVLAAVLVAVAFAATGPAAQENDGGAVVVILDASGSMNRVDDGGTVLIDGAKDAIGRLVDAIPDGSEVGLVVYGHRVGDSDEAASCQDTEVLVPVGPLDREAVTSAVSGINALGYTPIARALQEAAAALPDGEGTVILVSDGEDTCAPPDPCEVAAGLAGAGVDVRVHTVGFFLDDGTAQDQLGCIADATGGTYRAVGDIDALAAELGIIVRDALPDGSEIFFVPLDGGLATVSAPALPLVPSLNSADGFAAGARGEIAPGETRWYRFDVDGPMGVAVSASADGLIGMVPGSVLRIVIVDDEGVRYETGPSRFGLPEFPLDEWIPGVSAGTTASFSGYDVWWSDFDSEQGMVEYLGFDRESYDAAVEEMLTRPAPPLVHDGTYYVGLTWDGEPIHPPVQISVTLALWPDADIKHVGYQNVDGGLDAADAATVRLGVFDPWYQPPGVSVRAGYLGTISSGETRWYGLPGVPGESVAVRAFLNRAEGAVADGQFSVAIHSADGTEVDHPRGGYDASLALEDEAALDTFQLPHGLAPRPLVGVTADGDDEPRLIAFTWDGPPGQSAELEIVVDVTGDLSDEPPSTDPEPDPGPQDDRGPGADDGTTGDGAAEDTDPVDADRGDDGAPILAIVLISLGGVGLVAAAVVVVRRRR